jgi:hypothetical protein
MALVCGEPGSVCFEKMNKMTWELVKATGKELGMVMSEARFLETV